MKDLIEQRNDESGIFGGAQRTLADVLCAVQERLEGSARRDARSAFGALEKKGDVDLGAVLARPAEMREMLGELSPSRLGVSPARFANIKSLIVRSVAQFGMRRSWATKDAPLNPAWEALLATAPKRQYRWGLSRFACYCTAMGIQPEEISSETLTGFQAALEAEAISTDPRNIRKRVIALWNMCARQVDDWPDIRLSSPFKTEPFVLALEDFPEGFRADLAAWETRMATADPLDPFAPVRPYRPATILAYRNTIRRLVSALVRGEVIELEEATGLAVLFDGDNVRQALRPFLDPETGESSDYVHKMATQLRVIGRDYVRLPDERLEAIDEIIARLRPKGGSVMGVRNRERLKQFDDDAVVQRLLGFPNEELTRALSKTNSLRRAKGVERALAIALLIFAGIRVKNLREIRLDVNLRYAGGRVFLRFSEEETKSRADFELELPANVVALLERFVAEHREQLPGAENSPYLFPGETGGPRSYSAMRDAVSKPLSKHAGIELSPHLYRHIIAKIVVERRPELALDVSRRLGHKSINMTYQHYLGTETASASRRINKLLAETRAKPPLKSRKGC